MGITEQCMVDCIDNIVQRKFKTVKKQQQCTVNDKNTGDNIRYAHMLYGNGDNGSGTVAQCQTLHHTENSQRTETVGGIEDALP